MPKTSVLNIKGEQVGEIELSDVLFGAEVNTEAMHTLVVNYLANQRQGTQSTKTRTEVRGGGKKPWETKRNRPCKTGQHQSSPVDGRRCCFGSQAEKLSFLS